MAGTGRAVGTVVAAHACSARGGVGSAKSKCVHAWPAPGIQSQRPSSFMAHTCVSAAPLIPHQRVPRHGPVTRRELNHNKVGWLCRPVPFTHLDRPGAPGECFAESRCCHRTQLLVGREPIERDNVVVPHRTPPMPRGFLSFFRFRRLCVHRVRDHATNVNGALGGIRAWRTIHMDYSLRVTLHQ